MRFRRIRDLREDADKTQADIAACLRMNRNVYQRYEAGDREIPVWLAIELAKLYDVSTDFLFGLIDEEEEKARAEASAAIRKTNR